MLKYNLDLHQVETYIEVYNALGSKHLKILILTLKESNLDFYDFYKQSILNGGDNFKENNLTNKILRKYGNWVYLHSRGCKWSESNLPELKPVYLHGKSTHEDKSDMFRFKKGDLVRFNLDKNLLEVVGTFIGMSEGKKQVQLEDGSIYLVDNINKI